MFLCGVITILLGTTLLTSASSDFIPIPSTPFVGTPMFMEPKPLQSSGTFTSLPTETK